MSDKTTLGKLTDAWKKYNQVRVAGDKKTANRLLAGFIGLLKQQDEQDIHTFVDNICSDILDTEDIIISNNGTGVSDKDIRIQHPLFKEIILPVLAEQYEKGSARHIKWIGQLEQFFYSDNTATEAFLIDSGIPGYFEARYFFERSFAIDNNQKTLILLLNRIAQDIDYYTHEIPTGVLVYPEVLDKELETFRQYLQQSASKNAWEHRLAEWEFIAEHWRIYFAAKDRYDNFEHYLNSNGIQLD